MIDASRLRVVATDLDRTLLRSDGSLSPATVGTLRAVAAAGLDIVYVTARHLSALRRVSDEVGLVSAGICCGGAITYALPSCEISGQQVLDAETIHTIADRITAAAPRTSFGWVTAEAAEVEHDYPDRLSTVRVRRAGEGRVAGPVFKLFARNPWMDPARFDAAVAASVAGLAEVSHRFDGFADIVAPGVDKTSALRRWCADRGVRAGQVVAFGDSAADLGMLRWAGVGVAVQNAEQDVLRAADAITGACDADGVAAWLAGNLLPHRGTE
ncbi:HAD family hydrolase [Nonomuraea sp. NPDC059023]|uniref:HAD family hydrolase n=1 Tax=unclassified Nonomuraea TaxID=2593643 RepID=UPI00368B02F6